MLNRELYRAMASRTFAMAWSRVITTTVAIGWRNTLPNLLRRAQSLTLCHNDNSEINGDALELVGGLLSLFHNTHWRFEVLGDFFRFQYAQHRNMDLSWFA